MKIQLTDDTTLILERGTYDNGGKYKYTIIKGGLPQGAPFLSKKPLWEEDENRDKKIKQALYKIETDKEGASKSVKYKPDEKRQILIDAINSIPEDKRKEMEAFMEDIEPMAEWNYTPNTTYKDVLKGFHKLLFFENDTQYLVTMSTFLTNKLEGDPVWLMLVAPPSTSKSEIVRSITPHGLVNEFAHPVSMLTANTFISGHEDADDLLPRVNGKIVTMKDFTTLLSKNVDTRNEIFSQLREMYDGYMHKETGNGTSKGYECHVTIVAGVTQEIDKYAAMNGILGARFIQSRTRLSDLDRIHIASKASQVASEGNEDELRLNISNHVLSLYRDFKPENLPSIPKHIEELIRNCADIGAVLRTGVSRDYKGMVDLEPESESPARIMKAFVKLAKCMAYLLEKDKVDLECVSIIYQLAIDSVEKRRVTILKHIDKPWVTTKEISQNSNFPHSTCNLICEDLVLIGVVGKKMEKTEGKKKEENKWIRKPKSIIMFFMDKVEREIRYQHRHESILFDDEMRFEKHYELPEEAIFDSSTLNSE